MKEAIKEVVVVEGAKDTKRLQLYFDVDTIETGGSAVDREIIERVRHAQEKRGVIVFTDPDTPGERIRRVIQDQVPGVKHAFLNQEEARPTHKGSLGIEHAKKKSIKKALEGLYQTETRLDPPISKIQLMKLGLMGQANSAKLRDNLGERLRIGHTNSKQLQKRLQVFGISLSKVQETLEEIRKEEDHG